MFRLGNLNTAKAKEAKLTDSMLVERVLDGNSEAFEILVVRYQQNLFSVVMNVCKDYSLAEEFVQDAFVKAYEKLDTLKDRELFYPWIKRIAINNVFMHFEKNKRVVDVDRDQDEEKDSFFDRYADSSDPEQDLLSDELKKYVRLFVDALPEKLRNVILLREVEDYSYEEIAEIMKIPVGTVRSRLFNARQFVKQRLINQGLVDGMSKVS